MKSETENQKTEQTEQEKSQSTQREKNMTNWQSSTFRKAYNSEYAKRHPRVLFAENEYQEIKTKFEQSEEKKLGVFLKKLALSQIRNNPKNGGVDEQAMKNDPFKIEQEREKRENEMIRLISNACNNLNQVAHHLNTEALQQKRRVVQGKKASNTTLEYCFSTLNLLESQLQTYFENTKNSNFSKNKK